MTRSAPQTHRADRPGEPEVSVIVPAVGSEAFLGQCLERLMSQDLAHPYEIIAIIREAHPLLDELRRTYPLVRFGFRTPADGPGGSRNCGIELARGRHLAFIDADCLPDRNWLTVLLATSRSNPGAIICGWVTSRDPLRPVQICSDLAERGITHPRRPMRIAGIWGANFCVANLQVQQSGARFRTGCYGAEEIEFLHGLSRSPLPVILVPAAPVTHTQRISQAQSLRRMYRLGYGSGQVRRSCPVRGACFAHHPWSIPLLVPSRLCLTAVNSVRCGWPAMIAFLLLWPLVLLNLLWYAYGFAAGARSIIPQVTSPPLRQGPDS